MPPKEKFVHCTVCQARTSKFTVIKGDRLCGDCLSSCKNQEGSVSAFMVEFIDQSLLESSKPATTSMQPGPEVKIETAADEDKIGDAIGIYRVGSLPEGVVVQIENDIGSGNASLTMRHGQDFNKPTVTVKIEFDNDIDNDDSRAQPDDQLKELGVEPKIEEELTIEEPRLTDVQNTQEPVVDVKCLQCDKCFQQRKALQQHVRRMHEAEPVNCDVCGLEVTNTDRLKYHKRTVHDSPKLQCPHCPKKFKLTNGLNKHMLWHTRPNKDSKTGHLKVACRYCDHRTTSKTMLYKHYDEFHVDDRMNRCRICFLWFKGRVPFEQHVQEKHQGHQRQCDICLQGYDELLELEQHKGKCLGRVLFECATCLRSYVKKDGLLKHFANHDGITEDPESLFSVVRSLQKIFICALCGDDRGYEEEPYNTHVKEAHNGYHLLCPDCGSKFRQHRSFVNHRSGQCRVGTRAQEKVTSLYAPVKSQCPHCSRCYKNRWGVEVHIRRIHKAKPAECDVCGLKLASTSLVKTHKISVHTEPKFECSLCQKKFSSKYNYQSHLISHQKEGINLCEQCGGKFKTKYILKLHIKRAHENGTITCVKKDPPEGPSTSKEHMCEICEKCFSGPVRLRIHMKIHDPNRKQYGCEMCDAKFLTRIGLKQHMANKDAHQEATCSVCNTFFKTRERYDEHMLKHVEHEVQE
ncbi:zinc finger protein 62-like [Ochlerotatus camptorhynchus]|uniref:zinc finger protein 62-like n=1 Tax=Ochlerotatus camptorhynchus TaxID=644619 RepID=UPI0031D5A07C